ncbi:MAG TPA: hypothetical protein VLF60_01120 [Candidatus Saccharimonadales bacterium]|nr:hypothetical protein [Candidatus Saccharimonadales bacterium]
MFEQGDTYNFEGADEAAPVREEAGDLVASQPPINEEQEGLARFVAAHTVPVGEILADEQAPILNDSGGKDVPEEGGQPAGSANAEESEGEAIPLAQGGEGGMNPPGESETFQPADDGDDENEEREESNKTGPNELDLAFESIVEGYEGAGEVLAREERQVLQEIQPGDTLVESLQIGNTQVTAVLTHSEMRETPQIAETLRECKIVVIGTSRFKTEEDRLAQQAACNNLTKSGADPDWVAGVEAQIAERELFYADIADKLLGSDNIIRLAKLTPLDEPRVEVIANAYFAREHCTGSLSTAPPIEEAREALLAFAQAEVAAIELEKEVLIREIEVTAGVAEKMGASVGVVLPIHRFGVVDALKEGAPQQGNSFLAERVERSLLAIRRPVIPLLRGDIEQTQRSIDRTLLGLYIHAGATLAEGGYYFDIATNYAAELGDEAVQRSLAELEPQIADRTIGLEENTTVLKNFAAPFVADMRRRGYLP